MNGKEDKLKIRSLKFSVRLLKEKGCVNPPIKKGKRKGICNTKKKKSIERHNINKELH